MSLILALSSGYLVYVTHVYVLYVNPMGLTTLGYSIGFVELAVVVSMMLRMYNRLYSELVSKGYSEEEVKGELSEYVKHMLMMSSVAFVASILVYLAFSLTTVSLLDPITALVIFQNPNQPEVVKGTLIPNNRNTIPTWVIDLPKE